jgi:hypothetical protein
MERIGGISITDIAVVLLILAGAAAMSVPQIVL